MIFVSCEFFSESKILSRSNSLDPNQDKMFVKVCYQQWSFTNVIEVDISIAKITLNILFNIMSIHTLITGHICPNRVIKYAIFANSIK